MHVRARPLYLYLAWDTSNKGAPDYVEGVRPGPVRGGRTRTRPTIFQTVQRAQRRKTATLQVRLRVLWCVEAGIVECLKGWRCMVGGVWKVWRYEGWWEGWCVWGR